MLLHSVGLNSIQGNFNVQNNAQNSVQNELQKGNAAQPVFKGSVEKALYQTPLFGDKIQPSVKKMLDESKFVVDTDYAKGLMTIKEFIEKSITNTQKREFSDMYHASFSREQIDNILKKGFDFNRISRAQNGPGVYFGFAEGQVMNYGPAKLTANLEGKTAFFEPKWYDKLIHGTDVVDRIHKFTGANFQRKNESSEALNRYVRNLLTDEMGYDLGYANGELICFNPNAIKSMAHFPR